MGGGVVPTKLEGKGRGGRQLGAWELIRGLSPRRGGEERERHGRRRSIWSDDGDLFELV